MGTKFQLFFAVLTAHLFLLSFVKVSSAVAISEINTISDSGSNKPQSLQYLGLADGKAHFAEVDETMRMTHRSAAAHCQASGLRLASIESAAQVEMLELALNELGYSNQYFWTSAIEARQPSTFKWNETEGAVDESLVNIWGFPAYEQHYCVTFSTENFLNQTGLYVFHCNNNFFPMCHT